MKFVLRNLPILVGITLSLSALAHAAPTKIQINPSSGIYIATSKKFNKKSVSCRHDGGMKFVAGFVDSKNGQSYWNNIGKWTKNVKNKKKFRRLAWKKLLDQSKKASKVCSKIVQTCHPQAEASTVNVVENTPANISLAASDPCQLTLQLRMVNSPSHGNLEGASTQIVYTPDRHSLENDSFTYKVWNGFFESSPASVQLQMQQLRPEFAGDTNSLEPYRDTLTR